MSGGTIPDRGLFAVVLAGEGTRVGELDEEMVHETRLGDVITLGASSWRVDNIGSDRVIVRPAPTELGKVPFWHGDRPGRPAELGRALGAFLRELAAKPRGEAQRWLEDHHGLERATATILLDHVQAQLDATGVLPTDRAITIERFRDELGDWRVCLLSPFGSRVHAPWAMAMSARLGERAGFEIQPLYNDNGIVLRFSSSDEPPDRDLLLPRADDLEGLVMAELSGSGLFASHFRENAARSLLLPRS